MGNTIIDWDEYFINLAEQVSLKSKDPSTKTGVIIVSQDNAIISCGFNGFPIGVNDDPERYLDRTTKLALVSHAERNSVYLAARNGNKTKGCKMYTNFGPQTCHECAKAIIQAGIVELIGEKITTQFAGGRWEESIKNGNLLLNEAGVKITEV